MRVQVGNTQIKLFRRRKMIWFNPPYSRNVKTNIDKIFCQLLVKHFPVNNKMHQIFNKSTSVIAA